MSTRHLLITGLLACSTSLTCHAATDDPAAPDSALMRTMARTNTFGHPDQYGQLTGMQDYTAGHYKAAMRQFLIGARYADKLSQLSIGLMYLQGQGVTRDPVQALAWISLSAERRYPKFVATRDQLAAQLSQAQQTQARQRLEELMQQYGDAIAKPRMVLAMHESMQYVNPAGRSPQDAYTYLGPPQSRPDNCGINPDTGKSIVDCGLYAHWRWDRSGREGESCFHHSPASEGLSSLLTTRPGERLIFV